MYVHVYVTGVSDVFFSTVFKLDFDCGPFGIDLCGVRSIKKVIFRLGACLGVTHCYCYHLCQVHKPCTR